jgi:hypothetical protein
MISDRDKGLVAVIFKVFPLIHYLHYSQYLADNIQKNFEIVCRTLFWRAANTYTEHAFIEAIAKIKSEKKDVYEYLNKISHTLWL